MKRFDDDDEEFIESRKHKKSKSKHKSREKDLDDLFDMSTIKDLKKELGCKPQDNAR